MPSYVSTNTIITKDDQGFTTQHLIQHEQRAHPFVAKLRADGYSFAASIDVLQRSPGPCFCVLDMARFGIDDFDVI